MVLKKVLLRGDYRMSHLDHYSRIAAMFEYPGIEFPQRIKTIIEELETQEKYQEAVSEIKMFFGFLPVDDLKKMQELFTRSFDVQSVTTLDLGYVLFGDDYKRGDMLANLNREHRLAGNELNNELSDHLPNLLRLIPKLTDEEVLHELVEEIIAPALRIMVAEFSPSRIDMKNKAYKKHYKTLIDVPETNSSVLYQHTLKALRELLMADFKIVEKPAFGIKSDFLHSITQENEIEAKAENLSQ